MRRNAKMAQPERSACVARRQMDALESLEYEDAVRRGLADLPPGEYEMVSFEGDEIPF